MVCRGRLNACYNCVIGISRRGPISGLIWVPEPEAELTQTSPTVSCTAGSTRSPPSSAITAVSGPATGSPSTCHGPRAPGGDAGCAPSGSSLRGLRWLQWRRLRGADRRLQSRFLVTIDGYYRNGDLVDHKAKADEAVARAASLARRSTRCSSSGPCRRVRVADPDGRGPRRLRRRSHRSVPARGGASDLDARGGPLFLMYTSGTTGVPRVPNTPPVATRLRCGYSKYYQDIHPTTPTGAWPTSAGSPGTRTSSTAAGTGYHQRSSYEGVPPIRPRTPWRIAERLGVTIFHHAPTSIRMLRKLARRNRRSTTTASST